MALRKFKPTTPARRYYTVADFTKLSKKKPERSLVAKHSKTGGRNNNGRMTSINKGGGHNRRYRKIDFRREKFGIPDAEIAAGNALPLSKIPLGQAIHNVELKPGRGGQLVRSAGNSAQLAAREGKYALLRMPSGEMRKILVECYASIGRIGNTDHSNISLGKAGRSRWLGRRPHTRGVVKNPVDHPMGGGEGKSAGGRHPCTPKGKPTKGYKTRKNKRTSKFIVRRRVRKKKG